VATCNWHKGDLTELNYILLTSKLRLRRFSGIWFRSCITDGIETLFMVPQKRLENDKDAHSRLQVNKGAVVQQYR
jgi:hypothetical protein